MLKTLKIAAIGFTVFTVGAGVGSVGTLRWATLPILRMAVDGWCTQPATHKVTVFAVLWFPCQDAAIAHSIQAQDADTSAILDLMRENQPKKVKK